MEGRQIVCKYTTRHPAAAPTPRRHSRAAVGGTRERQLSYPIACRQGAAADLTCASSGGPGSCWCAGVVATDGLVCPPRRCSRAGKLNDSRPDHASNPVSAMSRKEGFRMGAGVSAGCVQVFVSFPIFLMTPTPGLAGNASRCNPPVARSSVRSRLPRGRRVRRRRDRLHVEARAALLEHPPRLNIGGAFPMLHRTAGGRGVERRL